VDLLYRRRNGDLDPSFSNIFLSVFDQAEGAQYTCDKSGIAVIYGDTNGELYRRRSGDLDPSIFLSVVDQAEGAQYINDKI
jgi:hypothetical protein